MIGEACRLRSLSVVLGVEVGRDHFALGNVHPVSGVKDRLVRFGPAWWTRLRSTLLLSNLSALLSIVCSRAARLGVNVASLNVQADDTGFSTAGKGASLVRLASHHSSTLKGQGAGFGRPRELFYNADVARLGTGEVLSSCGLRCLPYRPFHSLAKPAPRRRDVGRVQRVRTDMRIVVPMLGGGE